MELTLDEALQKGIGAQRAGQTKEADELYTLILKAQPKHPDANHNLGVLAVSVGKLQEALPLFKTALETNPSVGQFWLSYIDALIKLGRTKDAQSLFVEAKRNGVKDVAIGQFEQRIIVANEVTTDPPKNQLQPLINLYRQGQLQQALDNAKQLLSQFPNSMMLYNIKGAVNKRLGQFDAAIDSYKQAIQLNPNYADAYNNLANALIKKGDIDASIDTYKKALKIRPDYAEAHYNMGVALKDKGDLEAAINSYKQVLKINPHHAETYNSMGSALNDKGDLDAAIISFKKALKIKPDYAEAYNNMGNTLNNKGNLDSAIDNYKQALKIKPDYAEAHHHLSSVTKYNERTQHVAKMQNLHQNKRVTEDQRCHLSFALAKAFEDITEISQSFSYLKIGNELRKKILSYNINQDIELFSLLKQSYPSISDVALKSTGETSELSPIFILGMPRSGTTLVEQIVSSHLEVTGAGELNYVECFGKSIATGVTEPNTETISNFRQNYIEALKKRSDGRSMVTDKMPQNFLYIGLIFSAIPDAKVIHVNRNPAATCWSNYKHYFATKGLGYGYDLDDMVEYFGLYKELMQFWQGHYGDRIYNLNYDNLTINQKDETKKLIHYIGLKWEDDCLSPQSNQRNVRTASSQQVREKVYQGSSQQWRKFEPYLNGVFDQLNGHN